MSEEVNLQLSTLTEECGHHCGTKDKRTAHCDCKECHKGELGKSNGHRNQRNS